ncbi:MAG: methyltransferase domain-containing protein [Chloroflexi bacterium]|nr:methyltransferase domain-containing protein [Chloroflexota bacterium]
MRSAQHFEKWSHTYEHSFLQRLFFDRIHAAVLAAMAGESTPGTVLDVGCGTGRLLRAIQRRWPAASFLGIDPTVGMIAVAQRLAPDMTLCVAAAERIPLEAESVDVVVSTMSFHHWTDKSVALNEIARVLRPGSRLFLVDHTVPRWLRWINIKKMPSPPKVGVLMTTAGLSVVRQVALRPRWIWLIVAEKPEKKASIS